MGFIEIVDLVKEEVLDVEEPQRFDEDKVDEIMDKLLTITTKVMFEECISYDNLYEIQPQKKLN